MSTTCALRSRRPSSNTANSPMGPAPMMTASVLIGSRVGALLMRILLPLLRRRVHHEPVELVRHFNLTGKPRGRFHVEGKVEHVLLHRRGRPGLLLPRLVHMHAAGRARARAAAFGDDAGDAVPHRAFP